MTGTDGTSVVRHESDVGCWTIARLAPSRTPAGLAGELIGWAEQGATFAARRELPSPALQLILGLSGPTEIWAAGAKRTSATRCQAFLAPITARAVMTAPAGPHSEGVQVALSPAAARAVGGVDLSELRGRPVELSELLGPSAGLLLERIATTPDWAARLAVVDEFLAGRIARARPSRAAAAYAWRRLVGSRGRLRVSALASEMGLSRQRLSTIVREEAGIGPKALAMVARGRYAGRLLAADPPVPLVEIAARCGYSDQQHLTRDLARLAGCPPGRLRADLLPDGGGIAVWG